MKNTMILGAAALGLTMVTATTAFADSAPANIQQMAKCVFDNVLAVTDGDKYNVTLDSVYAGIGYPDRMRVSQAAELIFGLPENAPSTDITISAGSGSMEGKTIVSITPPKEGSLSNGVYAIIDQSGGFSDVDGNAVQGPLPMMDGAKMPDAKIVQATMVCAMNLTNE